MKKSLETMLVFSLAAAMQKGAKVVFYTLSDESANKCYALLKDFAESKGYLSKVQTRTFEWPEGGKLFIRALTHDSLNRDGGLMITHVFVEDDMPYTLQKWAEGRIRSTSEFAIEAGMYTSSWAKVYKRY